jgi:hypothetical protein
MGEGVLGGPSNHGIRRGSRPSMPAWYSHARPRVVLRLHCHFIQLAIAMLPWVLNANWGIFLVTAAGNILALVGSSLPQWRAEKWACPKTGGGTVIITQGNGSRHAVVILGRWRENIGLDLEVRGRDMRAVRASRVTRVASAVLALFWIVLLIAVAGLRENTWCMSSLNLKPL